MSRFVIRSIVRHAPSNQGIPRLQDERPWANLHDEEPDDLSGSDPFERLAAAVLAHSTLNKYKDNVRVMEVSVGDHAWRVRWMVGNEQLMVRSLTESFRKVGIELDGNDIACLCKDLW
jgi:hypothetical protein